jgi:hypothetical protein
MKKILFLFLLAGLFYACKKDKIGTKPTLSFKGYSLDSVVASTQVMFATLDVRDGDGDIEDTLQIAPIYDSKLQDTFYIVRRMPEIGANRGNSVKAEVAIRLDPIDFRTYQSLNDSIHFLVFIRDNAGNISDTLATPKIPYNIP